MSKMSDQCIGRILRDTKENKHRGSLVQTLPGTPQVSLFDEPPTLIDWSFRDISLVTDPEGECKFPSTLTNIGGTITVTPTTASNWASQSYVDGAVSDHQILVDRIDELEKKLTEYIERDTKSTISGHQHTCNTLASPHNHSYEGTVSNIRLLSVDMAKDPVQPSDKIQDFMRVSRSITKEEWKQMTKEMKNG